MRCGGMKNVKYAFSVYLKHFRNFKTCDNRVKDFVCLELGPGDSLFSALITYALGGSFCYLIDIDRLATSDVIAYRQMADYLSSQGLPTPKLSDCKRLDDVLTACHACYGSSGLKSLQTIPSASVDFLFSQAVLEHVNKNEVYTTMKELHRISKKDGICSHSVDLRDHLTGSLNHLRVPECLWEATGMNRNSTNRLRYPDFLRLFKKTGFTLVRTRRRCWKTLPISKERLSHPYRAYNENDLRVRSFDIVLKA